MSHPSLGSLSSSNTTHRKAKEAKTMPNTQHYIRFTHENPEEGVAYWGPFPKDQLHHRLNDAMAVEMEEYGTVDSVPVSHVDQDAFINPAEDWIAQAIINEEEGFEEE